MIKVFKKGELWMLIFLLAFLSIIYKDVIFRDKIVFPSNLLASFCSPWATYKFPGWPTGIPNKPIGGNDQVRMFYPYRTFINESFAKREFPLWNPYNFSGSPIIADFQSAVFYPLNLIYFFLPQITAWSLLVVIQPILVTLFMYLYLRQFITQKLAAFFGAFAFGFSGFILTWSQENAVVGQAALWFPLILFAADKYFSTMKLKYFTLLTFSLTFCILSGFLQLSFYIFFVSFCYGIFRITQVHTGTCFSIYTGTNQSCFSIRQSRLSAFLYFLASFLISFLICAIQLLPSIEAFGQSPRSFVSIQPVLNTYLLPFTHYITLLAPDIYGNPGAYNFFGSGFYHESIFYIGIIPLVFALLSICKMRGNKIVKFFIWATVVSFLLGIKSFFTQWFYTLPIPVINTFTPSRILFVSGTGLAILSAFGLSFWLKIGADTTKRILFATIAVIASVLIVFIGFNYLGVISSDNLIIKAIKDIPNLRTFMSITSVKVAARNSILPLSMLFSLVPLTLLQKKYAAQKLSSYLYFASGNFISSISMWWSAAKNSYIPITLFFPIFKRIRIWPTGF